MRLIFLSAATSFGGGERYLLSIIPLLRKSGYDTRLIFSTESVPEELLDFVDFNFIPCDEDVVVLNGLGSLYKWGKNLPKCKASIFIQHSLVNDGQSGVLKRFIRPMLIRYYLKKIDCVIRVCDIAFNSKYHSHVHTVHNGVDIVLQYPKPRVDSTEFTLGMLGSVNPNKNQEQIIRLLPKLSKHIKLRVVGDGPSIENLQRLALELKVADNIIWVGKSCNPISEILNCHVLLVLSKYEALPFAALEAMSCGIPVLSTNVGGMPELVHDGFNGYTFDFGDNNELEKYVNLLANNEGHRQLLGRNAIKTISNDFNTYNMLNQFVVILKSIEHHIAFPIA